MTRLGQSPFVRRAEEKVLDHGYAAAAIANPSYEFRTDGHERDFEPNASSRRYSLAWLQEHCAQLEKARVFGDKASVGYISLMNLMKEIEESPPDAQTRFKRSSTAFVELNKTRFVPSCLAKSAKVWDPASQQAFEMGIMTLLNRLTRDNIKQVVEELTPRLTSSDRVKFVVAVLNEKAANEHLFSELYAQFTRDCGLPELRTSVVGQVTTEFFAWAANKRRTEGECHIATGCAKFYGALVAGGLIGLESGQTAFELLIQNMENGTVEGMVADHVVQMMVAMVGSSGADFARRLSPTLWSRFDVVLKKGVLSSRLNCLLQDVADLRDEFLFGTRRTGALQQAPVHSESAVQAVRLSFENYKDTSEAMIAIPAPEFLCAAGVLFPDQTRDGRTFGDFICEVLAAKRAPVRDVVDTLSQIAGQYLANRECEDAPKLWAVFDDLLYLMMLRGLLYIDHVKTIWGAFPKEHNCDVVNGMKWFLFDQHSFATPIAIDRFPSDEVREALMMPTTIEQRCPRHFRTSRLIAVAVVRSIAAKVADLAEPLIESFLKWKDYVYLVMQRQKKVFDDELDFVIMDYEFPFSKEQLVALCTEAK
jgi:hypothetical protein